MGMVRFFLSFLIAPIVVIPMSLTATPDTAEKREQKAIEAFQDFPVLGADRSSEVLSYPRATDSQIEELQHLKVLLVPGFLSDLAPQLKSFPFSKYIGIRGQFADHVAALEDWGVDYELLEIESEDTPERNAARLRDFIQTSSEEYIIISHSKGSIDALDAFIRYPEIRTRIKYWLSLQAPFWGTPVTEYFLDKEYLDAPLQRIMEFLGGSIESIYSVSYFTRSPYMAEHMIEIAETISEIPTLSVASTKPEVKWNWDTRFEPYFRDYLWKQGVENDGLIPWQSAVLPGTNYVRIDGLDHLWSFSNELSRQIEGKNLVQNLLKMMIELPHPSSTAQ